MDNLKEIVKDNLIRLRKENKITQLELAQQVGYSDKAVSRWETGETTPDVETLGMLAEFYNVPIATFFEKYTPRTQEEIKNDAKQKRNKFAISLLCIVSVWFVAIILFDVFHKMKSDQAWLTFIWAIPTSFLLAIIFNAIWGKRIWTFVFSSVFCWTFILSIYLQLMSYISFMIFISAVPIQAVIIIAYFIQNRKGKEDIVEK